MLNYLRNQIAVNAQSQLAVQSAADWQSTYRDSKTGNGHLHYFMHVKEVYNYQQLVQTLGLLSERTWEYILC